MEHRNVLPSEQLALQGLQEAHDTRQWPHVVTLGDAWLEAQGEMPAVAATLYAEGLMVAGRVEEAVLWSGRAVNAIPAAFAVPRIAALTTYGRALARAGAYTKARTALAQAVKIPTDHAETQEKQGHIICAISDKWRKGWALQEQRLAEPEKALPENFRAWDGRTAEPVSILHEQGIGDAVLFARWAPQIAKITGHPVTWYGPKVLHRWMADIPGVVLGDWAVLEENREGGAGVRAMSLPHVLRCNSKWDVPMPVAPVSLQDARSAFRSSPMLTVGVCWKGSASGWHDFERSYTPEQFAPLWALRDHVQFVNLCHDANVSDNAPFAKTEYADIYANGEAVAGCDLVITVDTSVVHIAGSLGIPTICLVPTVADWRFEWPTGHNTPFYPSVTVVRRRNIRDVSAIDTARRMLDAWTDAKQQVTA